MAQQNIFSTPADIKGHILNEDSHAKDITVLSTQFTLASGNAALVYVASHPGTTATGATVTIPQTDNFGMLTPLGGTLFVDTNGHFKYTASTNTHEGNETFTCIYLDVNGMTQSTQFVLHVTDAISPDQKDALMAQDAIALTATYTEYQHNLLHHESLSASDAHVAKVSFETDNAQQYIYDNFFEGLGAVPDQNGVTVHIPFSAKQTDVTFITQLGATLTVHKSGDCTYNIGQAHQTAAENFQYEIFNTKTGETHHSNLEMQVLVMPDQLISLSASSGMNAADHAMHPSATVQSASDPKGADTYIINVSELHHPEKVVIMDLGSPQKHILQFTGVGEVNHPGHLTLSDVVTDFHSDGNDVTMTLNNHSTLILQNIGPIVGTDIQSLDDHLHSIALDLLVLK